MPRKFQVFREPDAWKSEDRWKIICSIAQDSRDFSKGKSSAQHTSSSKFLFQKLVWLIIMTEIIIDDNKTIVIIIITNMQGVPTERIFCNHDENQQ